MFENSVEALAEVVAKYVLVLSDSILLLCTPLCVCGFGRAADVVSVRYGL